MHMADALISATVGAGMYAASGAAVGYSGYRARLEPLLDSKIPLMAVAGAFVFAAQMINFSIPGTGSSGHIGGGILLAALLGGPYALLTITAVLTIQCLFFGDGGLLALGCNIFNMGVIPCLLVYPLIFRPLMARGFTPARLTWVTVLCTVLSLQIGAFAVVLQTLASGITALPFGHFVALMLPIHLPIGLVEGLVTAAVLNAVMRLRPELLPQVLQPASTPKPLTLKPVLLTLGAATLLTAGLLSLYASAYPDGLEWSTAKVTGQAELTSTNPVHGQAKAMQEKTVIMPDYDYASQTSKPAVNGTSAAGLLGSLLTFALTAVLGALVVITRRRQRQHV